MSFCPKCGAFLKLVHRSATSLRCEKCGFKAKLQQNNVLNHKPKLANCPNEIAVIDKKESGLRTFPVVRIICPACGETESEIWTVAVGSEGTTASLTFFRCTACGHTRRETE